MWLESLPQPQQKGASSCKDAHIHMAFPAWEATVRSSTCTQGSGRLNQVASLRQTMEANHESLIPGPVLCDWPIKSLFLPGLNASLSMSTLASFQDSVALSPFPVWLGIVFSLPLCPCNSHRTQQKLERYALTALSCLCDTPSHQRQHQPITDCRHRSAPQCPCRLSHWRTFWNSEPGLPKTQSCRDQQ